MSAPLTARQLAREWGVSMNYVSDARRGLTGAPPLPAARFRAEGARKASWCFSREEAARWLATNEGNGKEPRRQKERT